MNWNLPISVKIDGKEHKIRNRCDYRVVLDVISALNDEEMEIEYRICCALALFYGNDELNTVDAVLKSLSNIEVATNEMMKIISLGEDEQEDTQKPQLMDWEHDFLRIAPPVSKVLGYDIREVEKYTHWYTFIGGYQEIGESMFSTIISIRNKRIKGKALDDWERDFYREHKKLVELPRKLTEDERDWLESEW